MLEDIPSMVGAQNIPAVVGAQNISAQVEKIQADLPVED